MRSRTNLTILILLPCLLTTLGAQSLEPAVINSAGGHWMTGDHSISWSVGESAISTYFGSVATLSEGFLQALDLAIVALDEPHEDYSVLIYPNPLNPTKYVVINSGPTFREGHDRTNSLQNPKLPDWAVIDLSQPPDELAPGRIAAADFFDEDWQLQAVRDSADQPR